VAFSSAKAALASAARMTSRLGFPSSTSSPAVQSEPDRDRDDLPILVRTAMRRAKIDPDSDEARLLYAHATTTDRRDVYDDALEHTQTDADYLEVFELGEEARARLDELLEQVEPQLEALGVVVRLRLATVGWRVHEHPDGRREVVVVTDPDPADERVYRGARGFEQASSVATRLLEGHVCRVELVGPGTEPAPGRLRPDLAAVWEPRWERGEFRSVGDLDRAMAVAEGCTIRWAQELRLSWGLRGRSGRPRKASG
jgi:hypothetical protein